MKDEEFVVLDEHLRERAAYADSLVSSLMILERETAALRKIIGYEVVNEYLGESGFRGKQADWMAYGKKPCDLYFILNEEKTLVKIGISKNANGRIKEMQTATGYYLELLNVVHFPTRIEAAEAEAWLHKHYSLYRRKPIVKKTSEWFEADIIGDLMLNYSTIEQIREALNEESLHQEQISKVLEERFG